MSLLSKFQLKLTEDSYVNDLVISIVMCLSLFAFYFLYQVYPAPTLVLVIGVPVVIVAARWMKIHTEREQGNEPGPFELPE